MFLEQRTIPSAPASLGYFRKFSSLSDNTEYIVKLNIAGENGLACYGSLD